MKSYEKSVKSLDEIQRFRNPYTFLGVGDPLGIAYESTYNIKATCASACKFNHCIFIHRPAKVWAYDASVLCSEIATNTIDRISSGQRIYDLC